MLSSSLSQLLERARTRFGLEVEVLDAGLQHVYPDSSTALARLIEESPVVRQSLLDALSDGRPEHLHGAGAQYQVFPLRRPAKVRHASALVAVRRPTQDGSSSDEQKAWPELARAIVEADFAAADALTDERQHSRRLLATLRFLRHLVETDVEAELGQAIVQAAAVWFDVDARIFQRDLAGDFVLHTALPGARMEDAEKRLNPSWLPGAVEAVRLGSIAEWGQAGGSEVLLVPFSASGNPDWVLALIGTFPTSAEALFAVLGRVVGVQLETIRTRRRDCTREHFESLVEQGSVVPELLAVRFVRELMDKTGAAGATLILNRRGRERRVVSIGTSGDVAAAPASALGAWRFTPTEFACTLPLGDDVFATLDLRAPSGESFAADAELVTRVAARVLQSWLAGAEPSLHDVTQESAQPVVSEFVRRIEEELERAKRFDLRLSLVLIDVPGPVSGHRAATSLLKDAVRQELRGSDVLGTMNGARVAALLTHTDGSGSHKVVGRLRRRLSEASRQLNLAGIRVGHAAFSPECRTAEALLAHAAEDAEPVAV
jgi:hypothetical protein